MKKYKLAIISILLFSFLFLQIGCIIPKKEVDDTSIKYDTSINDYYDEYTLELPFEIEFASGLLGEIMKGLLSNPSIAYDNDSVGFALDKDKNHIIDAFSQMPNATVQEIGLSIKNQNTNKEIRNISIQVESDFTVHYFVLYTEWMGLLWNNGFAMDNWTLLSSTVAYVTPNGTQMPYDVPKIAFLFPMNMQ